MSIDMTQFYQVFFDESAEHLGEMESLLLELDVQAPDVEQLNAIFRAAHSIKGSAGTFGFTDLSQVTHILENLLDKIRKNELPLRSQMVDAFLEAGDLLKDMLAAHQGQEAVDAGRIADMCERLRQLSIEETQQQVQALENIEEVPQVTAEKVGLLPPTGESNSLRAGTLRLYDIEFVPTEQAATSDGLQNFLEDLAQFGTCEIVAAPENQKLPGFWRIRLSTDVEQSEFAEHLDFIADNEAWRVSEDRSIASDGSVAFGLFEGDVAGLPDKERGYGFFEQQAAEDGPVTVGEVATATGESSDDSYGFFTDIPDQSLGIAEANANAQKESELGYGFFEPIAEQAADKLGIENASTTEERNNVTAALTDGDGYGFFEPTSPTPGGEESAPKVAMAAAESRVVESPPVSRPVSSAPIATTPTAVPSVTVPVTSAVTKVAQPEKVAEPAAVKATNKSPVAGGDSSIRVSVEKVDQLINLVGELVITQAMLQQTASQLEGIAPDSLTGGLTQLERNTRDLQESVMSIRMLPISFVFSRFPRVVRDLSSKLGKQVELKTSGETTELDKGLIERITDPLTHLIRNSLDHGVETPDIRAKAGKPPVGTITLKASHQGGNIVIEVGDDGAGLNRQRILSKAREKGMQVSDQMTDQEVFGLIFEAGFSTAEQVTDVSGRGVGMDVVRKNIQALGGRIEIESMPGIGTRMTVRLPLTLAILDGMSIGVGSQTYILPLSYVIESIQPRAEDIRSLANEGRVIQVRGEYLPVIVLSQLFNIPAVANDFPSGIMAVLEADGSKVALFVDALLGQHQVVIKSLEANYRRVPCISGATIMGDGHVALILDVPSIAGYAKQSRA
jgi:two-component system, chemotaxis family, sensor kinase CheA